jgi:hypothetical protein
VKCVSACAESMLVRSEKFFSRAVGQISCGEWALTAQAAILSYIQVSSASYLLKCKRLLSFEAIVVS